MHPDKAVRKNLRNLTDLPNVGPKIAAKLRRIGIEHPDQLAGLSGMELYGRLCEAYGKRLDPCLLDVMLSVAAFMAGGEAKPWWAYTAGRKQGEAAT